MVAVTHVGVDDVRRGGNPGSKDPGLLMSPRWGHCCTGWGRSASFSVLSDKRRVTAHNLVQAILPEVLIQLLFLVSITSRDSTLIAPLAAKISTPFYLLDVHIVCSTQIFTFAILEPGTQLCLAETQVDIEDSRLVVPGDALTQLALPKKNPNLGNG